MTSSILLGALSAILLMYIFGTVGYLVSSDKPITKECLRLCLLTPLIIMLISWGGLLLLLIFFLIVPLFIYSLFSSHSAIFELQTTIETFVVLIANFLG